MHMCRALPAAGLPAIVRIALFAAAVLLARGVSGAESSTSTDAISPAELAAQAKQILRTRCHDCHGGTATQAGLVILDKASLRDTGAVVPGSANTSELFTRITASDESIVMPKLPQPPLAYPEIDVIRRWIEAGAPDFPDDVAKPAGSGSALALDGIFTAILGHVEKLPRADRKFVRYFSLAHLVAEGSTPEHLQLHRDAVAKAINHLSRRRALVKPTIVDPPTGAVLAVDIRDLGWDATPFSRSADTAESLQGINLWDLALLDYPYGVAMPGQAAFDKLVQDYILPAGLVRPVAFVRGDWFVSVVTQPPLYEDFLRLPLTAKELERELGVPSLDSGKRGGVTISGVSQNSRVVERHRSNDGSYWLSVDFQSSKGRENMFRDPVNISGSGGEYIFALPNGLQGYFLADASGNRLSQAPTSIVTDTFAEDRVVRNGLACMRCHDRGMKRFADDVRPSLEKLTVSSVFDLTRALELYPVQKDLDRLLDEDSKRFMAALEQLLGHPQTREPLAIVSRDYLRHPVSLSRATAEAGLSAAATLRELSAIPHFASLGLVPLATGGSVRRDMWEDFFDEIVRQSGVAVPVVPIDGLLRGDYPTARPAVDVSLRTNQPGNVLRVGEEASLVVENRSDRKIFIELVGTDPDGRKVVVTKAGTTVSPKDSFKVDLKVQPGRGREFVTLFAADREFPAGQLLRGENVADRVVHPFYRPAVGDTRSTIAADAASSGLVKQTIAIETK